MLTFNESHAQLMRRVAENRELAMAFANLGKQSTDDYEGMEYDYMYAEHMAHALHYLIHARKLRIKEKTNYGNQF